MLAYFVSHSRTDTSSISLMMFRGPLIILHVLLFHLSSFSFTTYYNEKAGTSQARTCSFYVDHFIHRFLFSFFYASFHFFLLHILFYYFCGTSALLCCFPFSFFFLIIWIFVYILLPFIHSFPPFSIFFHFLRFFVYISYSWLCLAFASIFSYI